MYAVLALQQEVEVNVGAIVATALLGALVGFAIGLLSLIAMWRIFSRAGQPGWAAIIPIYNTLTLLRIVGRPGWWFLLFLVPFVNIVVVMMLCIDLARSFGKSDGYGLALFFLAPIFFPALGFSNARYVGPSAAPQPAYAPIQY